MVRLQGMPERHSLSLEYGVCDHDVSGSDVCWYFARQPSHAHRTGIVRLSKRICDVPCARCRVCRQGSCVCNPRPLCGLHIPTALHFHFTSPKCFYSQKAIFSTNRTGLSVKAFIFWVFRFECSPTTTIF